MQVHQNVSPDREAMINNICVINAANACLLSKHTIVSQNAKYSRRRWYGFWFRSSKVNLGGDLGGFSF